MKLDGKKPKETKKEQSARSWTHLWWAHIYTHKHTQTTNKQQSRGNCLKEIKDRFFVF
jgi:hypothetical protein